MKKFWGEVTLDLPGGTFTPAAGNDWDYMELEAGSMLEADAKVHQMLETAWGTELYQLLGDCISVEIREA